MLYNPCSSFYKSEDTIVFLVFFKRKKVCWFPDISYTVTVVGSKELEAEKSSTSPNKNLIEGSTFEVISVFSAIFKA